jgi:hypothetical protein
MKALHGIIIGGAVAALAVPALATGGKKMAIEVEEESSSSSSSVASSPKQTSSPAASSIIKNSVVATGPDLINEMKALHTSLGHLQTLLESAYVKDDTELLRRSAKFFRRARWLIYASNHENVAQSTMQRRMGRRGDSDSGGKIRGGIGGIMVARSEDQERRLIQDMPELKDDVARNLYEAVSNVVVSSVFTECVAAVMYRVDETTVPPIPFFDFDIFLHTIISFSHNISIFIRIFLYRQSLFPSVRDTSWQTVLKF